MAVHSVSSSMSASEIVQVIRDASSGDIVEFAAGSYGALDLDDVDFDAGNPVVVTGAQGADVEFVGRTVVDGSTGLRFEGVTFQADIKPERTDKAGISYLDFRDDVAVRIQGSTGIEVTDSVVKGRTLTATDVTVDDPAFVGLNVGIGIVIENSANVTISDNDITKLGKAIGLDSTDDVTIDGNRIFDIREDAIRGGSHHGTTVSGNLLTEMNPYVADPNNPNGFDDEHSDFLQFWGEGSAQKGIVDFTITGNVFFDEDDGSQVIFGWNRFPTEENAFRNFTITDNVIYGGHKHAIQLGDVQSGVVANNTLIPNAASPNKPLDVPVITVGSTSNGVTVIDNIAPRTPNIADDEPEDDNFLYDAPVPGRPVEAPFREDLFAGLAEAADDGRPVELTDLLLTSPNVPNGVGSPLSRIEDLEVYLFGDGGSRSPGGDYTPLPGGTPGADYLYGTEGNDLIDAGAGDDRIEARGGDDYVIAGSGRDWNVSGGSGADVFVFGVGDEVVKVLDFESGIDRVEIRGASSFDDLIITRNAAHSKVDVKIDGAFDRLILANIDPADIGSTDFVFADGGTPPSGPQYTPLPGGTPGNDYLYGTEGNDFIDAGAGDDRIEAGAGDDYVIAGAGKDWNIIGGAGSDVFVFGAGDNVVKVLDFEDGVDRVEIRGASGYDELSITRNAAYSKVDVKIDGTADRLILVNIDPAQIDAGDFVFV